MQINEIRKLLGDIEVIQYRLNRSADTRTRYNDDLVEISFLLQAEAITDNFSRLYAIRKNLKEFITSS